MQLISINPATGKILKRFAEEPWTVVLNKVERAWVCFEEYRSSAASVRSKLMTRVAEVLLNEKEQYARLITLEMGKPIKESLAEIEKCALVCNYYAENAKLFLKDEPVKTEAANSYIVYEPLGIILGIMPWNFPFWQVFRFAVPALIAGNVCLVKHASNVPQCALAIEEVFRKAGFSEGAFTTLLVSASRVKQLIADERIRGISLTGSDKAGAKIAALAGAHVKKTVLELGGSDPFIVLDDANIREAATAAVKSRMINTGQSCIAAKRFIVTEIAAKDFVPLVKEEMGKLKIGDPMDMSTDVGPMAREDLAKELLRQVQESVKKGAKILLGGGRPKQKGAYFEPTLLTNVKKGMPAYDEELFGPVASIIVVRDAEEALRVANDTPYGLGASIWTVDTEKGARLARKIEAGIVFINGLVHSDPRLPFGGVKRSGYGRELSYIGFREFTNPKSVVIE